MSSYLSRLSSYIPTYSGLSNAVSSGANALYNAPTAAYNASKAAASGVSNAVSSTVSNAVSGVSNAVSTTSTAAFNASKAAASNVSNAVSSGANALYNAPTAALNAATSLLPQTEHSIKASEIKQELETLQKSLSEKTGTVFKQKVSETIASVQTEKNKSVEALKTMNGTYYQDPQSTLKIKWDELVKAVDDALGVKVERLDQLEATIQLLNAATPTAATNAAKTKINEYKEIEKIRNARQTELDKIISAEKANASREVNWALDLKQDKLKKRQLELCGSYYGDRAGKLDQAWQKYQADRSQSTLDAYQALETERKQIEAQLYEVGEQRLTPVSIGYNYEILTAAKIETQLKKLNELQVTERDLSGVDWRKIATNAGQTALKSAGYLLMV